MFDKVLVANRGEIALRIIRTLKKMNIKSVAIYSEADTNALHVQYADEAHYVGNSPAVESYLSIPNILHATRLSGAKAVHPGYGFLAENYQFASTLEKEKIVLIGPSSQAIKQMGDKIEAKQIATKAGIQTVPGYMGAIPTAQEAIKIAKKIGFPVIIKAAAGGGGMGMRVAHNHEEMMSAFASAQREAQNSFNDNRLFIEKFIQSPRHIEIQVLADKHGNVLCLGERECSIQRSHQKVIEEAPSPFVTPQIRQKMYNQAASLAKKVKYHSAGTVEFIMNDKKNFYFLEMNTRIQVEHPITEMITGIDLVEQMVRVAAGEELTMKQDDIELNGWAMEARICAEDPTRGFLPSSGRITEYIEPARKQYEVRIDSSIVSGMEVSMFYDSMIAKLCVRGETRKDAIEAMRYALGAFVVRGISHNMSFLEAVFNNPKFVAGDISTAFISNEYPDGFSEFTDLTYELIEVFIAIGIYAHITEQKRANMIRDQIVNTVAKINTRWVVSVGNQLFPVMIKAVTDGYNIRQGNNRIYVRGKWNIGNHIFSATVNGKNVNAKITRVRTGYQVTYLGVTTKIRVRLSRVSELESLMIQREEVNDQRYLYAPLSGQIIAIKVSEGDEVQNGQELMILTAMKMENIIVAPKNGVISKIHIKNHDHVNVGGILIEFQDE
ncbi:Acyl-CoA carboxylase subunit alpha [Rickettsiales endosymbiont of Paramecium tredecaurelia]|nr:Acyl-CoA carboxylase subunit alpha [Candidatus Sarmatiella mevalonica]